MSERGRANTSRTFVVFGFIETGVAALFASGPPVTGVPFMPFPAWGFTALFAALFFAGGAWFGMGVEE